MAWTWPRTVVGLALAILLGGTTLFIEIRLDAQRDGIIASGPRVLARVVDVQPSGFGADQSVVEYTTNGRTRRAEISSWSGLSLELGTTITVHIDPSRPERLASSEGYSSLPGQSAPFTLGILTACLALIVIGGRALTAYNERLEPWWIRRPRVWFGRRGIVRRNDWLARIVFGIGLTATVAAPWTPGSFTAIAFLSPIVVAGYVWGVSCGVVVTPVELLVYNAFTVTWIPRHLVKGFEAKGRGYVGIGIAGHRAAEVSVGFSAAGETDLDSVQRSPAQARTIAQLEMLVAAIPQWPNAGGPGSRRRWTTITAFAASLATFACLAFGVLSGRIPSA